MVGSCVCRSLKISMKPQFRSFISLSSMDVSTSLQSVSILAKLDGAIAALSLSSGKSDLECSCVRGLPTPLIYLFCHVRQSCRTVLHLKEKRTHLFIQTFQTCQALF